ncbi:hypothetical protein B0T20DRAFT_108771 [Sordaria brevicollis]|uniref:Uncharacterized protein n=1 Tax=Sordaria brevicollis TaxID=83679 RepID=A0AAE0NUY8_SORBR|nr:hypothetical protein B0T20DRAFT_108771 [Sordaria brevicollis]
MGCLPSRPQPSNLAAPGYSIPISDIVSFALDRQHLYDQNKPLFVDAEDPILSLSSSQTITLVSRLVAGLRAAGLKKGDVVLLHLGNHVSIIPDLVLCVVLSVLHYALHPSQRTLQKWSPASPLFSCLFPSHPGIYIDPHRAHCPGPCPVPGPASLPQLCFPFAPDPGLPIRES